MEFALSLIQRLKVSYCDPSVVRRQSLVMHKFNFYTTYPPKQEAQIQKDFTKMFFIIPSTNLHK